jgi:hypothetical protein
VSLSADVGDACGGLGGVKLTLVDDQGADVPDATPQFVCNGAVGPQGAPGQPGQPGTTGQSATTYLTSSALAANGPSCTYLPGYPVTVTVPSNSDLVLQSDGGATLPAAGVTTAIASVDVFLVIDNSTAANNAIYGVRRVFASNTPTGTQQIGYWSFARRVPVTAGPHTVGVCAALSAGTTTAATVAGGNNTFSQGGLTVTFVNR